MTRCAGATFPSLIPFVTPVLLGPDSDTRMKMGWKVLSKTRKSGVCFFQNSGVLWESGSLADSYGCGLIGYERGRATQRGRFLVVPHAPVRMRTGGAQLSGHILEIGVGHC